MSLLNCLIAHAAQQPKERNKITARKFNYIRNMLVRKMMDLQSQTAKTEDTEGTEGQDEIIGIKQVDLVKWYMETIRRALTSIEGGEEIDKLVKRVTSDLASDEGVEEEEISVIMKVINKLVRQGKTLAVLSRPVKEEGEEEGQFQQRIQVEQVLSLHTNYAPDDSNLESCSRKRSSFYGTFFSEPQGRRAPMTSHIHPEDNIYNNPELIQRSLPDNLPVGRSEHISWQAEPDGGARSKWQQIAVSSSFA